MVAKVRGRNEVVRNLREYQTRYRAIARRELETQAQIIEDRMPIEATWQDQTGDARRLLRCRVFDDGTVLRLQASHGVWYGVILEHGHMGKYAILQRTVRSQWPIALRAVAAKVKEAKAQ